MLVDTSPVEKKVDSAAVVVKALSELGTVQRKPGLPGDLGKTFDDIYDWRKHDDGVYYWNKGPKDFDTYLDNVVWSRTLGGGVGCVTLRVWGRRMFATKVVEYMV